MHFFQAKFWQVIPFYLLSLFRLEPAINNGNTYPKDVLNIKIRQSFGYKNFQIYLQIYLQKQPYLYGAATFLR